MVNLLHIANWYPSKPTPHQAPWIKNQVDALPKDQVHNVLYHLQINIGGPSITTGTNPDSTSYILIGFPWQIWRVIEWLSCILVLYVLLKERKNKYDLVNFHIAYPNLTYIKLLKKLIKCPILITEHWSAYHFNFNVKDISKLTRIKNIFHQNIPVMAVSGALVNDIKTFSGADFPSFVVPNVVDTNLFNFDPAIEKEENTFLMVSQWKWPKDPFTVIRAWKEVIIYRPDALLKIGGYGPQWSEMKSLVKDFDLESNIHFKGLLSKEQVAEEMKRARAFVHCSEYETFSVVCVEALCCGTPVIASAVGGINSHIDNENGFLIESNTPGTWSGKIINVFDKETDALEIALRSKTKFSADKVGIKYFKNIVKIIDSTQR